MFSDLLYEGARRNLTKKSTLKVKIMDYFTRDSKVSAEDIEEFAKINGCTETEVKEVIYSILSSFLNKGKYNRTKTVKIDPKELNLGIKVEMEHTSDRAIAERIARDHLAEMPGTGKNDGYYSLLIKMEKRYEKHEKKR